VFEKGKKFWEDYPPAILTFIVSPQILGVHDTTVLQLTLEKGSRKTLAVYVLN
jgi:hypothetical protein